MPDQWHERERRASAPRRFGTAYELRRLVGPKGRGGGLAAASGRAA